MITQNRITAPQKTCAPVLTVIRLNSSFFRNLLKPNSIDMISKGVYKFYELDSLLTVRYLGD